MPDPHTKKTLRTAAAIVTAAVASFGLFGCDDSLEGPSHPAVFGEDVGTDGDAADAAEDGAESSVDSDLDGGTD